MLLLALLVLLAKLVSPQSCRSYGNCAECVSNPSCNFDKGTCSKGPTRLNFNRWEEQVEFCYSFNSYASYALPFCGSSSVSVLDQNVSVNYVNNLYGTKDLFCKYEFHNFLLEEIKLKVNVISPESIEVSYWLRDFDKGSKFNTVSKAKSFDLNKANLVIVYTKMLKGVIKLPFEFGISAQTVPAGNPSSVVIFVTLSIVVVFLIAFGCNWARNQQILKERERRRTRIREIIALANNIRMNGLFPNAGQESQIDLKNKVDAQIEGKVLETDIDAEKCTVCQEAFKKGDELANIKCNHLFHLLCLREWLYVSKERACPNCKEVLLSEPEINRPEVEIIDVRRNFIAALTGRNRTSLDTEEDVVRIEDERFSSSNRNLTVNNG